VTTNDDRLGRALRLLRNHGMEPKYYHHLVGGNFRLDAIQAAVLRVKLPHLDSWTAGRQRNAQRYRALFEDANLTGTVRLPVEAPDRTHIYNQFVVRLPERDRLKAHLDAAGIGTEVYYPVPFHLQKCFASLGYPAGAFPQAEAAAQDSIALPIYPELTDTQQATVVSAIKSFYKG
jgi:dTDP-4-amino-4,6-dideoxygalactose transaminase